MISRFLPRVFVIVLCVLAAPSPPHAQSITTDGLAPTDTLALVDSVGVDSLRHPEWFDEEWVTSINAIGKTTPSLDLPVTLLTHSIYVSMPVVPLTLYGVGWATDDHEMAVAGMSTAASIMFSGLTTFTIKEIVRRNRPFRALRNIRLPAGEEQGYSFPSGHSAIAWAISTSLVIHYPRWYVIVPATLYSTAVSLSRPYVGVHYPTDILVGAVIGAIGAYAAYLLMSGIEKNFPSLFPEKKSTHPQPVKLIELRLPL